MDPCKLRILIVAEHASAVFGGEAFLPLHYFRVLRARGIEAWLLCHGRVEAELREAFPSDRGRLLFVSESPIHRVLWRLERLLPARLGGVTFGALSHLYTQIRMRRIARAIVAKQRVDVVHEPIPVSPKQASAMYGLGAPVVIGPMNGGMEFPPAFAHVQGRFERAWMRAVRRAASAMNRLVPGKRRAAALLVANPRTRAALPASVRHVAAIEIVENGVDLTRFEPAPASEEATSEERTGRPARFAFVGRLVDWKCVDALLEALARHAHRRTSTLDVFGDGPERSRLEALTQRLELGARVRFHGFVSQAEVARALRAMDALVLPSVYECGGAVVLEAMAIELPVIATRWGGPADYLDETCGVLVDPVDRDAFVAGLARALDDLASDPSRRRALGRAGRAKVERLYDWERKLDAMLAVYAQVADSARATSGPSTARVRLSAPDEQSSSERP